MNLGNTPSPHVGGLSRVRVLPQLWGNGIPLVLVQWHPFFSFFWVAAPLNMVQAPKRGTPFFCRVAEQLSNVGTPQFIPWPASWCPNLRKPPPGMGPTCSYGLAQHFVDP